jgi:hypothetical protein
MLLNCCRQAGKSTDVAILGLLVAMYKPMTRVVIVSRSHRQSRELLKTMRFNYEVLRNVRSRKYARYPNDYLHDQLHLVKLSVKASGLLWAKA